jgi:hypothetical protein
METLATEVLHVGQVIYANVVSIDGINMLEASSRVAFDDVPPLDGPNDETEQQRDERLRGCYLELMDELHFDDGEIDPADYVPLVYEIAAAGPVLDVLKQYAIDEDEIMDSVARDENHLPIYHFECVIEDSDVFFVTIEQRELTVTVLDDEAEHVRSALEPVLGVLLKRRLDD